MLAVQPRLPHLEGPARWLWSGRSDGSVFDKRVPRLDSGEPGTTAAVTASDTHLHPTDPTPPGRPSRATFAPSEVPLTSAPPLRHTQPSRTVVQLLCVGAPLPGGDGGHRAPGTAGRPAHQRVRDGALAVARRCAGLKENGHPWRLSCQRGRQTCPLGRLGMVSRQGHRPSERTQRRSKPLRVLPGEGAPRSWGPGLVAWTCEAREFGTRVPQVTPIPVRPPLEQPRTHHKSRVTPHEAILGGPAWSRVVAGQQATDLVHVERFSHDS